LQEWEALEVEH
jgi:hypothetical protein